MNSLFRVLASQSKNSQPKAIQKEEISTLLCVVVLAHSRSGHMLELLHPPYEVETGAGNNLSSDNLIHYQINVSLIPSLSRNQ